MKKLYQSYYPPTGTVELTDGKGNWFNQFGQELRSPDDYDVYAEGYTPFGDEDY